MPIIKTERNKIVLKKAESMCLVPYVYNEDVEDYVLGDTIYDLSSVIGDSITVEQSDGDTTTKENEFTGEIIVENVTNGKRAFTAQCLNLQDEVLRALFKAYVNTESCISALRKDFETNFALVRIRFKGDGVPDVYLPKVALNARMIINQMKTRASYGDIKGTVMSRVCSVVKTAADGVLYGLLEPLTDTDMSDVYQWDTPMLFVPKSKTPLFLHHIEYAADWSVDSYYFDELDFSASHSTNCLHNRVVSADSLSQYQIFS